MSDECAFPIGPRVPGLTKRELFAALAMQGLFAVMENSAADFEDLAHRSCYAADALLAELGKDKP